MTNNQLEILLVLRDKATAQLKRFQSFTKKSTEAMKKNWLLLAAAITAMVLVIKKAITTLMSMAKELINVNAKVESLKTRLEVLTGSVKIGNQVFADMLELAGNVPKTYEEIMEAATDLTAVVKDASTEIKQLMPIIVDISAATGMAVREVTSNMIRMYSAGAAAADMFRDRGVLSALGFQAKVSYTNEETMKILTDQWEDGTGKYVDAALALASTWEGLTSMMADAWFNFKQVVGEPLFEEAKLGLRAVLALIRDSKKEGGKYEEIVKKLGDTFVDMFNNAGAFMGSMIVAGGQMVDTWTEVQLRIEGAYGAMLLWFQKSGEMARGVDESWIGKFWGNAEERAQLEQDMALIEAELARVAENVTNLKIKSDKDYSKELKKRLDEWKKMYEDFKIEIMKKDEEMRIAKKKADEEGDKSTKESILSRLQAWLKANKVMIESAISMASTTANIMGELATMTGKTWLKTAEIVINTVVAVVKTIIASVNAALGPLGFLKAALEVTAITLSAVNAIKQIREQEKALDAIKTQTIQPVTQVPALAEGGIVTRPTLAMIGESGPEAVVPLGAGGGFRSINIEVNISEPQVRSLDDIYTLSEEVSDQISREIERL